MLVVSVQFSYISDIKENEAVTLILLYSHTESSFNSITIHLIVKAKSNQHYTGGSRFGLLFAEFDFSWRLTG